MSDEPIDISANPRVLQMLARIEVSRRDIAVGGAPPDVGESPEVDAQYGELGRYVHWLVRQEPEGRARVTEEARQHVSALDEAAGIEAIDDLLDAEVSFEPLGDEDLVEPSITELPQMSLSDVSGDLAVDVRDVDDIAPIDITDASADLFEPLEDDEDLLPEPIRDLDTGVTAHVLGDPEITDAVPLAFDDDDLPSDISASPGFDDAPSGGLAVTTGSHPAVTEVEVDMDATMAEIAPPSDDDWLVRLRGVLLEFKAPSQLTNDAAHAEAVRAVERVTTNMEVRWSLYPDAVQQALLGLVGARCRRLGALGVGEAETQLALGRLGRYARERSLLIVPSLRDRVPGGRDWAADERRYWAVLHAGL